MMSANADTNGCGAYRLCRSSIGVRDPDRGALPRNERQELVAWDLLKLAARRRKREATKQRFVGSS